MKTAHALKLVSTPKPLVSYDDTKGLKAITGFRAKLLAAAVRYIVDGKDGCAQDRIRTASNLSGITRDALCVAVKDLGN